MPDHQQAELIAAARAAINWARTRRATWTEAPLPVLPVTTDFAPAATSRPEPAVVAPEGPSAAARVASRIGELAEPVVERLPRVAAIVAMLAAGGAAAFYGGRYLLKEIEDYRARTPAVQRRPPGPEPPPVVKPKTTGTVEVSSTPPGAQVIVDGKMRGVTPLTLADVNQGRHTIELRSDAGTVQRTVTVAPGKTVTLDESIFSGFVTLFSPFEVVVTERGRTLRFDERNQVMLSPGRHELQVANRTLEYESVEQVELKPGETVRITIKPPPTLVTVTANELAQVWLDGARIGDVPVNEMPVSLGTHEIVVKRAAGGERRMTVTVTTKPMTLNVDFTR